MFRDIRKSKFFNRRALILGAGQVGLAGMLISRLGYLQLFKHKEYSIQADSNRINPMISVAPRGMVFDRKGQELISNESNYRLILYLESKRNSEKLVKKLAEILALKKSDEQRFLKKIKNARRKTIISLVDSLNWSDLSRIESNSYLLPGISISQGIIRKYPHPKETAHFLGYVSLPSQKEIENNEHALFLHPDFRIGKFGLEKSFDESLRGKYGVQYVEVDVKGVPLRTLSTKKPVEGQTLNLTIDLDLQKYVTKRIAKQVASVVTMDVKTGEILSYTSSPTFDPNNFVEGISQKYWQELIKNPDKPLNNKPISAIYPPGSTFKTMVAIAALEQGFDEKKIINCSGSHLYGRRRFHCWKRGGHGKLNMLNAIAQSCNTYFYEVAAEIGYDKFAEVARRFGYGEKFNIGLSGANSGNLPTKEWKKRQLNEIWVGGDTLNSSIGQGFLLATPLQMALSCARIANGGVAINPYLVKNNDALTQFEKLKTNRIASKTHLDFIKEAMFKVVNEKKGTAFWQRIRKKEFQMSGKTGTSQVISKRESEVSNSRRRQKAHGIFVGYAPHNNPKYAVSVVVEHGKSGSASAAPIGRDVLTKIQELDQIV